MSGSPSSRGTRSGGRGWWYSLNERENAFFGEEFNYPACELSTHFFTCVSTPYIWSVLPPPLSCPLLEFDSSNLSLFFFVPFLLRFALVPIVKDRRSNTRKRFLTITFTCPCRSMLMVYSSGRSGPRINDTGIFFYELWSRGWLCPCCVSNVTFDYAKIAAIGDPGWYMRFFVHSVPRWRKIFLNAIRTIRVTTHVSTFCVLIIIICAFLFIREYLQSLLLKMYSTWTCEKSNDFWNQTFYIYLLCKFIK